MASDCIGSSVELRKQGNEHFERFKISTNFHSKKTDLSRALELYLRSFSIATNDDERASAAKNYGMAAVNLHWVLSQMPIERRLLIGHLHDSVKYLSIASFFGAKAEKSPTWMSELRALHNRTTEMALDQISLLPFEQKLCAIEMIVRDASEDSQLIRCFAVLMDDLFAGGVEALGEDDHMTALRHFHNCHRPVEEVRRLAIKYEDSFYQTESTVKREELHGSISTAEALQAIAQGDAALRLAISDEAELLMDHVYDAMDLYRVAAVKGREFNVELEAIAMMRLGSLYNRVLRTKSRAEAYYQQAVDLASTLHPMKFDDEEWYQECRQVLDQYRSESLLEIRAERDEARAAARKKIESDVNQINQANVGSNPIDLLRFIYDTYPPKNPEHRLDCADGLVLGSSRKKALLKALTHYHPDKQEGDKFGLEWVVLCDEISKVLNSRYEKDYKYMNAGD